jgi:hypothetical protein
MTISVLAGKPATKEKLHERAARLTFSASPARSTAATESPPRISPTSASLARSNV